jgi:4-alpha-glucanotransferase
MTTGLQPLQQLAEWYNIELSYYDDQGRLVQATPESLLIVLQILGAGVDRIEQAGDALRARRPAQWRQVAEPVVVAWEGKAGEVALRMPARQATGPLGCRLELESGETRFWTCQVGDLPVVDAAEVEGVSYRVQRLALPGPLPLGYHRLGLQLPGSAHACLVLAAPERAYAPPGPPLHTWGGFLPMYAARSARNWGAGDFTDLENLITWTQARGGGIVGTLPFLAAFLDEPFEPSPYSPASRLFWNEFFLDATRIPELECNPRARDLIASTEFRAAVAAQQAQDLVDYRGQMAHKRRVLEHLAASFFAEPGNRLESFRKFVADHPRVEDYARFRATGEQLRRSWWAWPDRLRDGDLRASDYDEAARRYHLYVQWVADEQLRALSARATQNGPGLYLDYPLGVNPDSYDVWRRRSSFAQGISAGAPPDSFFTLGQDWGFPPLHPENIRIDGFGYLRDCLRHNMQYAGILRIDHMMGLHRFFWVPKNLGPRHGVYVRYPVDELYAVFCLESVRNKTVLVGEDLGTVPPAVRPAMERHHIHRLYVGQYEARADGKGPLGSPPAGSIAGMNTHDMPTFTAFWRGLDLADRQSLGLFDEAGRRHEEERRQYIRDSMLWFFRQRGLLGDDITPPALFKACLQFLASSPAAVVLANLEDLWQATLPQNTPGTWHERPNWQRKAQVPIDRFDEQPQVRDILQALDRAIRDSK